MKWQSRFFLSNTKELEKQLVKGEKRRLQTHLFFIYRPRSDKTGDEFEKKIVNAEKVY